VDDELKAGILFVVGVAVVALLIVVALSIE
jgi:hypothetical protein